MSQAAPLDTRPRRFFLCCRPINAYFAGELTEFDVELGPRRSDFQQRVWSIADNPQWGTRSYGEIADQMAPSAPHRAVDYRHKSHAIIVPATA